MNSVFLWFEKSKWGRGAGFCAMKNPLMSLPLELWLSWPVGSRVGRGVKFFTK
jgi:hypothetical protein